MLLSVLLVAVGVVLLFWGGEVLVTNAKALARHFGVSPLVIGLTVVAFATSCPELAATITATLRNSPDMALGNVIGSNIANIGLILGVTALLGPLAATVAFLRREVAFMLLISVLLYPLLASGEVQRWHGIVMLAALAFFLVTLIRDPGSSTTDDDENDDAPRSLWQSSLGVVGGLVLLVGGAQALVAGASELARGFGVPERVIGLSLVALGTSLPELATSIVAARRRETDIVLGNVIGSNIFNLLCILGITAIVKPIPVAAGVLQLDYWVMLATSTLVIVLLAVRSPIRRFEGALLLGTYIAYIAYLFR